MSFAHFARRSQPKAGLGGSVLPLALCLLPLALAAQLSAFDTDNEGWQAIGDPVSNTANWSPTDGNPGGHISVTDAATGGTWYFVAPAKFLGNKCGAYGKYLRYDQRTNDTTAQQQYGGRPDIQLLGGGITLIFDNAYNPGLTWTHYDVLLREDAGWRLNSISGPVPTQAQFRTVLANLVALQIRGEYRANADIGTLDNVLIESEFRLDLDADDSSGAALGDFWADTVCIAQSPIADTDALLFSGTKIDSLVLRALPPIGFDIFEATTLPPTVFLKKTGSGRYALLNAGGATAADFAAALRAVTYRDGSPKPQRGLRTVDVRAYVECGEVASATAQLPLFPPADAGLSGDTLLCPDVAPVALFAVLDGDPGAGGFWLPKTASSGLFSPKKDAPGRYAYVIPAAAGCPGDTAYADVSVERGFQLPPDTVLCHGDALALSVPPGFSAWTWSTGSKQQSISVLEAGIYALTGSRSGCVFSDSVLVRFHTCRPCEFYAPNVFSPNDDGHNDRWQIFAPCLWAEWRLEVYDRWGGLVFAADDSEAAWDGFVRGREALPGVYLWRLRSVGELLGSPRLYEATGDVTLLR
jgi:gliding motility-associated-like protein